MKESKTTDFVKALHYPLCEVPLSLANTDGTMRKTNKSKLANIIISNTFTADISKQQTAYIIDAMAYIRTMVNLPDTYERLTWQFLSGILKGFSRIDLVADSIKDAQRIKRGTSKKIIARSMKSKLPSEFSQLLSCGENKNRLIELLFEVVKNEREEVLEMLRCGELVLSREREYKLLTYIEEKTYDQLLSTQKEADPKIIAHAVEILHQDTENKVVIRSPSGNTDIPVLSATVLYSFKEYVVTDNGSGQSRKCIDLRSLQFSETKYCAMLGLHAFTGNDYLSSFFRKGKERCWKLMQKYEEFEVCFTKLGSEPNLSEDLFESLEEYTALLYGVKSKSINEARWEIFEKNIRGTTKSSIYPYCLLAKVF